MIITATTVITKMTTTRARTRSVPRLAVDPIRGSGDPQTRIAGVQTGVLFEQHARMVYGLCLALLRDPDDADDATQATFVSAHTSLLGGNEVREPAAWLATIARNECAGRAHAKMREPLPLFDADIGHNHGPEAELDRLAVVAELQQAISVLPEKQREAVVLRDFYGLQYAEVGAALGMSVASVESLLFRARRSLRTSLKPLASGALVVPVAVREGIAQALPSFTAAGAAGGGAASSAAALGLFSKLGGGPLAVKIAVGVTAVTAVGSVAVVEEAPNRHASNIEAYAHQQTAGADDEVVGTSRSVPVLNRTRDRVVSRVSGGEEAIHGSRSTEQGGGAVARARAADGEDDGPSGGRREHVDSEGARSSTDDGAETPEGTSNRESGFAGPHDDVDQGDARPREGGDALLRTESSSSGFGERSTTAGGGEHSHRGSNVDDSGPSGDVEHDEGEQDGAEQHEAEQDGAEQHEAEQDEPHEGGSVDHSDHDSAVTTPPPA